MFSFKKETNCFFGQIPSHYIGQQYVENTNNFKRAASVFEERKSQYSNYDEDDGVTLAMDHVEAAQKGTR
jgi:hypothetical protein